jgi:hypothetical protein
MTGTQDSKQSNPLAVVGGIAASMIAIFTALQFIVPGGIVPPIGALVAGLAATVYFVTQRKWDWAQALTVWLLVGLMLFGLSYLDSRPVTVYGTVVNSDQSPAAALRLSLLDSGGVEHEIVTDQNGEFEVNNVPAGKYTLLADETLLYSGTIPSGFQRLFTPRFATGTLPYMLTVAEDPAATEVPAAELAPTDLPIDTTPTAEQADPTPISCAEGLICEVFPQVAGTGGESFVFINPPGTLVNQLVPDCVETGEYGLKLDYAFTGAGNGGWGIKWDDSDTGFFNASQYTRLKFSARGGIGGETFQVGIRDTIGNEQKIETWEYLVISLTDWKVVNIPLSKFPNVVLSSLSNINFGVNRSHNAGVVCIDNIEFVP